MFCLYCLESTKYIISHFVAKALLYSISRTITIDLAKYKEIPLPAKAKTIKTGIKIA